MGSAGSQGWTQQVQIMSNFQATETASGARLLGGRMDRPARASGPAASAVPGIPAALYCEETALDDSCVGTVSQTGNAEWRDARNETSRRTILPTGEAGSQYTYRTDTYYDYFAVPAMLIVCWIRFN